MQIQTEDFIILINQEIEVLSEKTTFIQEQNDALRKDVKGLKDKYTEMENLINAKDESFKDLLQKERSEREDALKMLKEEINEKEGHIKKVSIISYNPYFLNIYISYLVLITTDLIV